MIDVGSAEDFAEKSITLVTVAGRELGIVCWDDRIYAIRNVCPHQGAPLCLGKVEPALISGENVGELEVRDDLPVIACPWHAYEFDLRTGRSLCAEEHLRVATYPIRRKDGRVHVDIARRSGGLSEPGTDDDG